ncbi:MAG: molybdopterin-dependent oxidoreductase [Candidatus Bathyarchaeota archaeon]|nr:molybdopterin-dependent oxidoreductase [Candidatus Bathyarchaeota archaeon]
MKKATRTVLIAIFILVIVAIPLYHYTRPDSTQPGTLIVKGKVNNPLNLTITQLEEYPSVTIRLTLTSSSREEDNGIFNYTGVLIKDLINQAQTKDDTKSVYVQASDGYGTTISLQDIETKNIIIAYEKDGAQLKPFKDNGEGPFRLIIADEQYAQRWVRDVVSLEVN